MASARLPCQASITDRERKADDPEGKSFSFSEKTQPVLQTADRSNVQLASFVMTITKAEFHCKMKEKKSDIEHLTCLEW